MNVARFADANDAMVRRFLAARERRDTKAIVGTLHRRRRVRAAPDASEQTRLLDLAGRRP